jgi:hypothetical protein
VKSVLILPALTVLDIYLTMVLRSVALVSDVEDNQVDGHQALV